MAESILPDHFPELVMGAHEFAVFCGCGEVMMHADKEKVQKFWATHVHLKSLQKLLQKPT